MEDPLAVQCNLVGNPLHEEQLRSCARPGSATPLNTIIDEDRDLVDVTFGEVIESHMAAVISSRGPRAFRWAATSRPW